LIILLIQRGESALLSTLQPTISL